MSYEIKTISQEFANEIIEKFDKFYTSGKFESFEEGERELFIAKCKDGLYLAIDNTTGECYCEAFHSKNVAVKYLRGMDTEEAYDLDKRTFSQK